MYPARLLPLLFLWLCAHAVQGMQPMPGTASSSLAQRKLPAQLPTSPLSSPNPAESLRVAQRKLQISPAPRTRAYMRMAVALLDMRRYNEALEHAQLALQQGEAHRDTATTALTYDLLGRVQVARGDSGRARHWYRRALTKFTQLRDLRNQAIVYEHLGDLYASQQAWGQAAGSYRQASFLWQRQAEFSRAAVALHAVGRMYLAQHSFPQALQYLQQSAQRSRQLHDSVATGYVLHSVGQLYMAMGKYPAARQVYLDALAVMPRRQDLSLLAMLYEALAATHDSTGNLAAAEGYFLRAVPLAQRSGNKRQLSNLYLSLSELHRRQGRFPNAFKALTQHILLADSVATEERRAEVAEIRMRYETEKKEQEIVALQKERHRQEANLQRQMWWRNGLGLGAVLLLLLAGGLYLARRRQAAINGLLSHKNLAIQRQKEELDRLNRSKDMLFSVISHDLRSPLSSLYTLLSLLNLGSVPPERLATHMDRLTRTLNTTLELLDNLLNWAMTQMRDEGVQTRVLPLEIVAAECVALLTLDAERKGVELRNELSSCLVRADENMCRLILRNLLSNAIKFTPGGGTVTVSGRRRGGDWEIAVADTGVGIAPANQEKLRQAAIGYTTPGTAREEGTGLGLRLCREFAELNGGRLTFDSVEGQGSVFRFTLPATEPDTGVALSAAAG
ncbi:ATP-binding protein [Hymenobacter guriensis]|uniref:histidine kinase n=1 Tax=Hymenobacter guriensis TaxID=2793065 RepID=A0ABS0KXX2_9BACT|nr:tetratricopeptide repeat protein [Hymenobacter guriensis]MBG8552044.1 tetratricopeptide repeat protein [Hymenobacter guriensis]